MKNACLGVLALLMLSGGLAFAGDEVVRLDFQAGSGCPSALALADQVRARTELVRFVDATAEGRPVRVRARTEGDHAIGRIRIGPADEAERVVTGRTCAEVISALALIAAVAVDPRVVSGSISPSGSMAPMAAHDAAASDASDPGAAVSMSSPPPDSASSHDVSRAARGWFGGGGGLGEVSHGLGARAMTLVGGSVFGEAGIALGETFRPALRLGMVLGTSAPVLPDANPGSGAATFRLVAGRLSACPLELRPQAAFVVRPCAGFELGKLVGTGRTVDQGTVTEPRTGSTLRIAASQSVQGRLRLLGHAWLELDLSVTEPLLRRSFVFYTPNVTVASVSAVEIGGGIGLGLHFP